MSIKTYKIGTKKALNLSILLAIAILLGYIDTINPYILYIKIGLANIITIIVLFLFGKKEAFKIGILRVVILSLLFINIVNFIISITAFIVSFIVLICSYNMLFAENKNEYNYRIVIMSILSSITHNLTQILVVSIIMMTKSVFYMIPLFVLLSILSGTFVGLVSMYLIKRIKNIDNLNKI